MSDGDQHVEGDDSVADDTWAIGGREEVDDNETEENKVCKA